MDVYDGSVPATSDSTHNMVAKLGQQHRSAAFRLDSSMGSDGPRYSNQSSAAHILTTAYALTSDMLDKSNGSSGGPSLLQEYSPGAPRTPDLLNYYNAVTTATSNMSVVMEGSTLIPGQPHTLFEVILISVVVTILSVITAGGNLMVMVSFKMDKQLQTVSNYFLLSLSVADFAIGIISMPLYSMYLVMNEWPLGPIVCDIWLSLDYTMSNASVANLLIISFDRYLSVTKPLSYRAKRTPKRAAIMISCAWVISAAMWTPWIFAWPLIDQTATRKKGECEILFLSTTPSVTVITAVAAFYLPVVILCVLYFKIYQETEKRQRDLASLQANRRNYTGNHRRTDFSDDDVYVNLRRNDSSPEFEDIEEEEFHGVLDVRRRPKTCWQKFTGLCKIDTEADYMEDSSSSDPGSPTCGGGGTPSSSHGPQGFGGSIRIRDPNCLQPQTPQQNGKNHPSRRNSGSGLTIPLITVDSTKTTPIATPSTEVTGTSLSRHSNLSSVLSGPNMGCGTSRMSDLDKACTDQSDQRKRALARAEGDMYTILIKLPKDTSDPTAKPSIQMLSEEESEETDVPGDQSEGENIPMQTRSPQTEDTSTNVDQPESNTFTGFPSVGRRLTQSSDALRTAMQARIAMRLTQQAKTQRQRRKRQEKKQEKKAAKTLSAILLAFIITWTPYNVFTVVNVFCVDCIPSTLYAIGYWLCYINSTINPVCYALCNANFRRTYWRIFTCRFGSRAHTPRRAGAYSEPTRETSYISRS